jgi:alpha-beta hydrolase superfamily lysophospholipase
VHELVNHIDLIDAKYGGTDVNKYIIGFSLGGLLTAKINALRPQYFKSMALIAPYFRLLHLEKFAKFNEILEELNKTDPKKKMMLFPMKPLPPEYTLHFVTDPIN